MEHISFDDFKKIDIRIGTIQKAEVVEGADKLLRLEVDFGEETRQIVSGIRGYVDNPQDLVGKQCPFAYNLEPRTIFGLESQGMIMACLSDTARSQAAGEGDTFALLHPSKHTPSGTALH